MENENRKYVFTNLDDILFFANWVNENFSSSEEYEIWFEHSMEEWIPEDAFCDRPSRNKKDPFKCDECSAQFSTKAGLTIHTNVVHKRKEENKKFWDTVENTYTFWDIVNNSYGNNEDHDEPDLSDTD